MPALTPLTMLIIFLVTLGLIWTAVCGIKLQRWFLRSSYRKLKRLLAFVALTGGYTAGASYSVLDLIKAL